MNLLKMEGIMKKIILLIAIILFLSGCAMAVYRNTDGQPAPKNVTFECDQKCGLYNSANTSPDWVTFGNCYDACMDAKGYKYRPEFEK
jgi:hypothetical protein